MLASTGQVKYQRVPLRAGIIIRLTSHFCRQGPLARANKPLPSSTFPAAWNGFCAEPKSPLDDPVLIAVHTYKGAEKKMLGSPAGFIPWLCHVRASVL